MKKIISKIKDFFGVKCCECGRRTWWAKSCWSKKGHLCIKCLTKSMMEAK